MRRQPSNASNGERADSSNEQDVVDSPRCGALFSEHGDTISPDPNVPCSSRKDFRAENGISPVMEPRTNCFSQTDPSRLTNGHFAPLDSENPAGIVKHSSELRLCNELQVILNLASPDALENDAVQACRTSQDDVDESEPPNDQEEEDGDTPLHKAIAEGQYEVAIHLVNQATTSDPSLLDALNDDWETPLHVAVLSRQPRLARLLLFAGADARVGNWQGDTPLHLACDAGDFYCVKALTQPFASSSSSNCDAAGGGESATKSVPNLEQRNNDGLTCLHLAACKGHVQVVRYLVQWLRADLETAEWKGGRNCLHLAVEHRQYDLARFIMNDTDADLDAETWSGVTAHHMAWHADGQLARELVNCGATPAWPTAERFVVEDAAEDLATEEFSGQDGLRYRGVLQSADEIRYI